MKTIAFIAGSGLAKGLDNVLEDVKKHKPKRNMWGKPSSYFSGKFKDLNVIILSRHGDGENFRSPATLVAEKGYEANIWLLAQEIGVEAIYGLTAVGSLELEIPLANKNHFVLPRQYVRGLAASQHSFGNHAKILHPNMAKPFDRDLIKIIEGAMKESGSAFTKRGVYIYNGGDCFETPAEITVLDGFTKSLRNRVVGMTTVPEAILSKQLDVLFAAIASNVNYAEGLSSKILVSHEQTTNTIKKAFPFLLENVTRIINYHATGNYSL